MSLFNRPAWAKSQTVTPNIDEAQDNIFSHSDRSFRDIVAEQERKKQAKLEKKKLKEDRRGSGKRQILEDLHERGNSKRRRTSLADADEEEEAAVLDGERCTVGNGFASDDHYEEGNTPRKLAKAPPRRSPRKNKYGITVDELSWQQSPDLQVLEVGGSDDNENENEVGVAQPPVPVLPMLEEDSDDDFAALARQARERKLKGNVAKKSQIPDGGLYPPSPGSENLDTGQGSAATSDLPDPTVELFVTSQLKDTNPMIIYRKLSQNIAEVRKVWCKRQGFSEEATKDVFFIHRMRRVYDVTTCRSLGLEVDAFGTLTLKGAEGKEDVEKVHLEAVTEDLFRQMKADRLRKAQGLDDELPADAGAADGQAASDKAKEVLIRLLLKAKGKDDLKLKVRPNTTFAKIATAYIKERLSNDQSARLEFDGETLEPDDEVQNTEVSDMDCIDVYILSN